MNEISNLSDIEGAAPFGGKRSAWYSTSVGFWCFSSTRGELS